VGLIGVCGEEVHDGGGYMAGETTYLMAARKQKEKEEVPFKGMPPHDWKNFQPGPTS
jgi:hypothetical protein